MSDNTDPNVEVPEVPAEAPVDAPADTGDAVAEAVADALDRLDGEIDQAYLDRLKKEAIGHRLRAKEVSQQFEPWKDSLDGWDDEQADAVRQLLSAVKSGDTDTIMALLGIDEPSSPGVVDPPPAPGEAPSPVTLADVERLLDERAQQAKLESDIKAIEEVVTGLGYEKGSNDYVLLLKIANENGGDLDAAHAKVTEWKQSLYDQFVADKAKGPMPPPQQGGPASGERRIETLDDSRAAAMARFGASQTS